jgi:tetratricopeptide (TPR) repeat protein
VRYRAFISYSHADAGWAKWLHRRLESYRLPSRLRGSQGLHGALPERLTPIFRDREDLSSAGQLAPQIEEALAESEALVVVCSPEAARSPFVESEVLAFKRNGGSHRIYAFIVAGEPNSGGEQECFPNALRFDLDSGGRLSADPANPLAADARSGKDGKNLARLKLLAGLFGLPLDTLRQRESQRRHKRMLLVTVASVLAMLLTSFLAVQAIIARNAAERRQKQAEDLVTFMLGDLNDKLLDLSRLDLLSAVNEKAMQYFNSLPSADVTDETLAQRAQALKRIGNIRLEQGQLPQAMESFLAAVTLSGRLASAAPRDVKRQLAHADVLAYIGLTRWNQGDLGAAQREFDAAHDVLSRARNIEPDNTELLFQLSTVDSNNGHVFEARGEFDQATIRYRRMLEATQQLVKLQPDKLDWQNQLGLAHNNLAKMALLGGDLHAAIDGYRADMEIEAKAMALDPRNNAQRERLLVARATLGRTLAQAGKLDEASTLLRQALDDAHQLYAIEPTSTSFQEDIGLYSGQLARLQRLHGDNVDAAKLAAQSLAIFDQLVATDSSQRAWQRERAETLVEIAAQAMTAGERGDKATAPLREALAVLEPQLADNTQDRAAVLATIDARLRLASLSPAPEREALASKALGSIEAQASARADPRLRALQVESLSLLGRDTEARTAGESLMTSGYRDVGFVAMLQANALVSKR